MFRYRKSLWRKKSITPPPLRTKSLWRRNYSSTPFGTELLNLIGTLLQRPQLRKGRYPKDWPRWREFVQRRAHYRCERCGRGRSEVKLDAHHIIPLSKGGVTASYNLMCLCKRCHSILDSQFRTRYSRKYTL